MLMRQLIGPYAGQIIDVPYIVAENNRNNGTMQDPELDVRVKGTKAIDDPGANHAAAPTINIPVNWAKAKFIKRVAWAARIAGSKPTNTMAANAIIKAYLAG